MSFKKQLFKVQGQLNSQIRGYCVYYPFYNLTDKIASLCSDWLSAGKFIIDFNLHCCKK